MVMQCFIHVKVNFEKKIRFFWKISVSCTSQNMIMLPHLIIHSSLHYLSSGRLREVKTKENFKLLAIKVVAAAYERWSLTRGSKYIDLTCELLVFWKTGRWGEVVETGGSTILRVWSCFHALNFVLNFPRRTLKDFFLQTNVWSTKYSAQLLTECFNRNC